MASSEYISLDGLHAVVTGGGSGIGLIITRMLLKQGTSVSIFDWNDANAELLVSSLSTINPKSKVSFRKCDVSEYSGLVSTFESAYEEFGRIDIVIANAGIYAEDRPDQDFTHYGPTLSPDTPPGLKTLDVNLIGNMYTVYVGVFFIKKGRRGGSVLCTSSIAGIYPFPMAPIYGTSKHGTVGFVRSIAPLLAREQITVNAIAPDVFRTNLAPANPYEKMIESSAEVLAEAVKELVSNRSLVGKITEMAPEGVKGCLFAEPPIEVNESTRHNLAVFNGMVGL